MELLQEQSRLEVIAITPATTGELGHPAVSAVVDIDAEVAAFAAELEAMDSMFSAKDIAFLEANSISGRHMNAAELAVVEANEARARQAATDYLFGRMMQDQMSEWAKEDDADMPTASVVPLAKRKSAKARPSAQTYGQAAA